MNLRLVRTRFCSDGIFGQLWDEHGKLPIVTLEHSFENLPKLPDGTYTCVRGIHKLHDLVEFTTYEITGVPGHTGILFHAGNSNADSEGCVLLGRYELNNKVLDSKAALENFLGIQLGCDSFVLVVQSESP